MKLSLSKIFAILYFGLFFLSLFIFLYWQFLTIKSFHDTEIKNFFNQTNNIVKILIKNEQDKIKEVVHTNIFNKSKALLENTDLVFIAKNKKILNINGFSLIVDVKKIAYELIKSQFNMNQIIKLTIDGENIYVIAYKEKIINNEFGKVEGVFWGVTILNKNQLLINQLKLKSNIDQILLLDKGKNIVTTTMLLQDYSEFFEQQRYKIIKVTKDQQYKFTTYRLAEDLDIVLFIDNTKYNNIFTKFIAKVGWGIFVLLVLGIVFYFIIKALLIKQLIALKEYIKNKKTIKINSFNSRIKELDEIAKAFELLFNELQKSNEQFSLAMQSSKDGLWDWNPITNEVYFSTPWKKMLGFKEDEITNHLNEWISRVHPDDIDKSFLDIKNHLDGKTDIYENIHRMRHKDGHWIWIYDRGKALFDENKEAYRIIGFHTDISKQKEYEKQIALERNKLLSIIQNIPDLLWIKDLKGVYILCNKRFEDFFGAKQQDIIGKTDYDYVDKDLADFFRKHDLAAINSETPLSNYEEITFASDGHKEYLHTTKAKLLDSEHNTIGVLGIGRDITELNDFQNKLENQKKEFETIFEYAQDPIVILDLNGSFLKINQAFTDLLGYSMEELKNTNYDELIALEYKQKNKKILDDILQDGQFDNFEQVYVTKDNKRVTVNLSISLLPDKKSLLLIIKDTTTLKLLEKQSKLASMGEMIGNIAHQWRQPLSIITTSATGMNMRTIYGEVLTKDEIQKFSTLIVEQAEYLSHTIDNFRDFLKGEKKHEKINVKKVLDYSLSLLSAAIKNNHITLIEDIDKDYYIMASINELSEAIINIVNNSKDVLKQNISNEDDRFIFVTVKKGLDDTVQIEFKDSGGGIAENIIDRIFEPYFTSKHQSVGTGLGLAMADKIVRERHQGVIDVYNSEYTYNGKQYKGACFTISLKCEKE